MFPLALWGRRWSSPFMMMMMLPPSLRDWRKGHRERYCSKWFKDQWNERYYYLLCIPHWCAQVPYSGKTGRRFRSNMNHNFELKLSKAEMNVVMWKWIWGQIFERLIFVLEPLAVEFVKWRKCLCFRLPSLQMNLLETPLMSQWSTEAVIISL